MKKDLDNIINDDIDAEIAQQMVDQFGTTPVMRINAEANYENMSGLLLSLQLHYSTIEKSMQYKAEKLEMLKNKDGKKARKLISALEQLNQQRITFGGAFYEILQKMHEL
jgi:plasmid maintenance system antidote protein VapI